MSANCLAPPGVTNSVVALSYRKTFIRDWRKFRGDLSLRGLASLMADPETGELLITAQSIGRIENRQQPYSQPILERMAEVLNCTPADLIGRHPLDTEEPWTLWQTMTPEERQQGVEMLKVIARTNRR